jgi:hypothetical protein
MTTVASTLLDFILGLLRDDDAAQAFEENPEAALASAGFPDVDPATVHALLPVMADSSPAAYGRHGGGRDKHDDDDRGYGGGHHGGGRKHDDDDDDKGYGGHHGGHKPVRDEDCDRDDGHWHKVWHDDKDDCDDDKGYGGHDREHGGYKDGGGKGHDYAGHGQEAAVIHNVRYVENNYSHTQVDYDIDIENAIWAGPGSQVVTGDDNVVAGIGGVAAGDDIKDSVINSGNEDNDTTTTNVNSGNTVNSGNVIGNEDNDTTTTNTNNGNIGSNVANGNGVVEDNDVKVEVDDVTVINDSFNGNTVAGDDVDQSTNVKIEDSLNGNQLAGGDITDVKVEDSLNGNNIAGDDVIEESVVDSNFAGDDVNQDSLVIEESLNGNNIAGDDVTEIEDSVVVDDSLNGNDVAIAGDDVEDVDQSSDFLSDNEILSDNELLSDNTVQAVEPAA